MFNRINNKKRFAGWVKGAALLAGCAAVGLCFFFSSGVSGNAQAGEASDGEKSLLVVTTIFPEYDWVRQILGEGADRTDVIMLESTGVDMHSFQPTVEDIVSISQCDLFIYAGGESDAWVADALASASNENRQVINLLEVLGEDAREEETVEGMQAEEECEPGEEEETEYDEHVWLSLKNARLFCSKIKDALSSLDPEHAGEYEQNAAAYDKQLQELDSRYQDMVESSSRDTLLFGDRFPFLYLTRDYSLNYYAAFTGCSAETEASFETVIFLAGKIDELGLPVILTIENSDHRLAETIRQSTASKDQEILSLNSLQSVTPKQLEEGITYLSVMEDNLDIMKAALA